MQLVRFSSAFARPYGFNKQFRGRQIVLDSVNLGFDDVLYSLFDKYAKNKKPISVDFRKIVPDVAFGSRATHLIHTYPAKLLPHIPYFFLNNNFLSQPGDNVLDPFCGSGTVLLEALLAERNAFGADSNPLARLITRVKTTSLDIDILKRSSSRLLSRIKETPSYPTPDFNNIEYWFYPHVIRKLAAIKEAIDQTRNKEIKDFFLVCFSNCTKKVSLADPRLSVPVRLRKEQYSSDHILRAVSAKHLRRLKRINVNNEFIKILNTNIKRLQSFTCIQTSNVRASIISKDARTINSSLSRVHRNQDLDLIITSPPYAGAQKYIRSSSLGMGWLGMCDEKSLKFYENLSIGREHYRKSEYCELVTTGLSNADNMLKMIHKKMD